MNRTRKLIYIFMFLFIITGCNNSAVKIKDNDVPMDNSESTSGSELYWGINNNTLYISAIKTENAVNTDSSVLSSSSIDDIPWYISSRGEKDRIKKVVIENTNTYIVPNSMAYWFSDMISCENIEGLENIDTSKVTNMTNLFHSCRWLSSLDLKSFDTSNVEDMSAMFLGCGLFTTIDLSTFNTSKVINMSSMFKSTKPNDLDLSSFDTSNVKNMSEMFSNSQIVNLNLSTFNTENVEDMSFMFKMCDKIEKLDLSNFNTKKVTNMYCMFDTCSSITYLNISSFDTSNVKSMDCFFGNANDYIRSLDISNINISNAADITDVNDMYRTHIPQ